MGNSFLYILSLEVLANLFIPLKIDNCVSNFFLINFFFKLLHPFDFLPKRFVMSLKYKRFDACETVREEKKLNVVNRWTRKN